MFPVFERLGLPEFPIILAPLAGVTDHPFRRMCSAHGADLTYVEMLSATALSFESKKTFEMMARHKDEKILGVQLTGRNAEETARAIAILDRYNFETIDINMGCPVKKVVQQGCGSAILENPERVYETLRLARQVTDKVLTCKIRLGWREKNMVEVAQAAAAGGAEWLTVHGRTRFDDYSVPVDLDSIRAVVEAIDIPVIGNGNIFGRKDAKLMQTQTGVAGVMVSRGALGDPWVFNAVKGHHSQLSLEAWFEGLKWHMDAQEEAYQNSSKGVVCLRKHLIWYAKGWPGAKLFREQGGLISSFTEARNLVEEFYNQLKSQGITHRSPDSSGQFSWEPKWDMDRREDRGVGDDMIEVTS